ncbi:Glyoxalase-like domain protein [compost metagenome]
MLNYRVENLVELLDALKKEGVQVFDKIEEFEFGKFGWIMDPEGNKIELWEPNDENYFNESK